jgi:phosphoribosylaminoimidazole-succinocarboxamide synthase
LLKIKPRPKIRAYTDPKKMIEINTQSLKNTIKKTDFAGRKPDHQGKVRDTFLFGDHRTIVVSDRVSAFDFVLGTIPHKGAVLNQIAAWWFQQLDTLKIPHHLIDLPHPNIAQCKNATVLPIEIVVRGYLTGTTKTSAWYAYKNLDRRICGLEMPEGMKKNEPFAQPIITPTTKPIQGHDEPITRQAILEQKLVEAKIWEQAEDYALRMFAHGQKKATERGLILVDTKYEMGLDKDGKLMVIDEVHTPDSSRYWIAESYQKQISSGQEPESLDKEFVRRMVVEAGYNVDSDENPAHYLSDEIRIQAAEKYQQLYETITGQTFQLITKEPITQVLQRLSQN